MSDMFGVTSEVVDWLNAEVHRLDYEEYRQRKRAEQAEKALAWWREVFLTRLGPGGFPKEGEALLGHHLHLRVEGSDGALVTWDERER